MRRFGAVGLALLIAAGPLSAQDEAAEGEVFKRHRLGVLGGVTWVPEGTQTETSVIFAPTIGLDYDYKFSEMFGAGVYTDFQLGSYLVETYEGDLVERDFVFVAVGVGILEATRWLEFFAGPGVELDENANYWVIRVGTSLSPQFGGIRGGSFEAYFDIKQEYVSLGLAFKIAARF
jgi:hypothetical protein